MTRRELLASIPAGAAVAQAAKAPPNLLLLSAPDAVSIRRLAEGSHPRAIAIRDAAEVARVKGPWSVTKSRPKDTPAGPNDFFREGPYWWPDPKNPSGPYLRRDGETNPVRFTANDRDMGQMSQAVLALGTAAYFFDKPELASRAAEVARIWFVDPATRMNPNLQFGQAVHGKTWGRPEGLIATRALIWMLQGVVLAEQSKGWDPKVSVGLKSWFRDFLQWMTASEIGRGAGDSGNNHASWWTAQGSAFAIYSGDTKARDRMFEHYRSVLLKQIQPDGSAPREEGRTRSLGYSCFNVAAMLMTCRLAQVNGKDLAHFVSNGASVLTAVRYLAPFTLEPKSWTKPRISKFDASKEFYLGLAGLTLGRQDFMQMQRKTGLTGGVSADLMALVFEASR